MNLTFGRYIKTKSVIHRMDPRLKLFAVICLIVSVFLNTGFIGYTVLFSGLIILILLSRLPISMFLRILKPTIFIAVFLFIINCFLIKTGDIGIIIVFPSANHSIFVISQKSIYQALYIGIRVLLMISITTLLSATTKPLDLTLAIEDLLYPFKLIRLPVHIISTIISIAFRMIPTLLDEAGRIMKAQASRGVDFSNGRIKEKMKSMVSLIVPLLVSSFQKAEDLSYAMDARGYDPYNKRTRYRNFRITIIDILLFVLFISFAVLIYVQYAINFLPLYPIDHFVIY